MLFDFNRAKVRKKIKFIFFSMLFDFNRAKVRKKIKFIRKKLLQSCGFKSFLITFAARTSKKVA